MSGEWAEMSTPCISKEGGNNLAGKTKTLCLEKVAPLIEEMGYEVIDVEYVKQSDGMNLIFYIDNEKGITLEDCEKVSKKIDPVLDDINPTENQPYILIVSSQGLDRPLKTERDFKKNLGKEIAITLFSKIDGKKEFKGNLAAFTETEVTISQNGQEKTFSREKIAHIVPIIKI